MESTTLYFKQASSDKVYQASIQPEDNGYAVHFAFGRRGSTLATGRKTVSPVTLEKAKGIFQKLIREKQAKGYVEGEGNSVHSAVDRRSTGIHCQLLTAIEKKEVERLLEDPSFWLQEKFDGRRLLIQKQGDLVSGINKLGFLVSVPEPIERAARAIESDFIIDGEAIENRLMVFDLLSLDGKDRRREVYAQRMLLLMNLLAGVYQHSIHLVTSTFVLKQKRALYEELALKNREGVVFKRLDRPYEAGRSDSQLKFKFCESVSCWVGRVNAKRSIRLELFEGSRLVSVGNVTIPTNHEVPPVGSVVEVRYLYAYEGGSLFQPVYLGRRDDVAQGECLLSQLKIKSESFMETV